MTAQDGLGGFHNAPGKWTAEDEAAYMARPGREPGPLRTSETENPASTTRHHEYAGRYEMVRKLLQPAEGQRLSQDVALLGQIALIALDLLEELAQVRSELDQLNATNLELIVHRRPL